MRQEANQLKPLASILILLRLLLSSFRSRALSPCQPPWLPRPTPWHHILLANCCRPPPLAFCTPPLLPQVFSLCYGTVHEEVNHLKRAQGPSKWKEGNLVAKISEEGVTFRSYRQAR